MSVEDRHNWVLAYLIKLYETDALLAGNWVRAIAKYRQRYTYWYGIYEETAADDVNLVESSQNVN